MNNSEKTSLERLMADASNLELADKQAIFLVAYDGKNDFSIMGGNENTLGNAIWNMMNDPNRRKVLMGGVLSWMQERGMITIPSEENLKKVMTRIPANKGN